jgi:hypothetical protein
MSNLKELSAILRTDYLDERGSIARIVSGMINNNLGDDESFKASSELISFGPANDYNGQRSSARRVNQEWEDRILTPALLAYHQLRK